MRKKDKEIQVPEEIGEILSSNKICRIALSDGDAPYIVPMNYGYIEKKIYLHTAKVGKKIDIIRKNNKVCFEVTDSIEELSAEKACNFSTKYRCVIGFGTIKIVKDLDRKKQALQILMKQHTGENNWQFPDAIVEKTMVLEIEIKSVTGKKSGF
ncbi:MAG: pyridoxamine 5'-phosphate oxidase family protein [candidate division WOR-3 bacterium]|jgi:nitroimidazol reductase NimA-like FMN-containing flavoprotein (pyridoxamine 5'-phosphate oxidase superfamily)